MAIQIRTVPRHCSYLGLFSFPFWILLYAADKLIDIVEKKISPFSLSEPGKIKIANMLRRYTYQLMLECVDIGYENYIRCLANQFDWRSLRAII